MDKNQPNQSKPSAIPTKPPSAGTGKSVVRTAGVKPTGLSSSGVTLPNTRSAAAKTSAATAAKPGSMKSGVSGAARPGLSQTASTAGKPGTGVTGIRPGTGAFAAKATQQTTRPTAAGKPGSAVGPGVRPNLNATAHGMAVPPAALAREVSSNFSPMTINDADFRRLVAFMRENYGIDLSQKRQLITGRLSSSLRQRGYGSFSEFVDHLLRHKDNDEMTLLLNKLTTNYTFFMREKDHLDYFSHNILPELVRRHQKDKVLSIWSAGCSSGEEPYNISMLLFDHLGPRAREWDARILATDISAQALATARRGVYELPDTIPAEWRKRYFVDNKDGTHTVAPIIKDNIVFQTFNLMEPIRFRRKFDVIFCRNVMIYFDQPTKDALVNRFYDATVPGGYLLISYSENLSQNTPYKRLAPATFVKT